MTSSYAAPDKRRKIDYGLKFEKDMGPTDCTIVCEDIEFKVHKSVLAGKSEYLDVRINQKDEDAEETKVVVSGESVRYVQAMLHWMYHRSYDDSQANDLTLDPPILFNIKLHGLADRWEIPKLKELCASKLDNSLSSHYTKEDSHDAIGLVYDSESKKGQDLGDILGKEVAEYLNLYRRDATLRQLFEKHGGFAAAVMDNVFARFPTYNCSSCKRDVEMQAFDEDKDIALRCVFCSRGKLRAIEIVDDDDDSGDDH